MRLTRRSLFAFLAAAPAKAASTCPIGLEIEAGPSVKITVPGICKEDLVGITSGFLGNDHPEAKKKLAGLLRGKATDVTLVMTTKCQKAS